MHGRLRLLFSIQGFQIRSSRLSSLAKGEPQKGALYAADTPINKYSIVTSGRGLSKSELANVASAISELDQKALDYCVSLGILDPDGLGF